MKQIEVKAKSVHEAIADACEQLGVAQDEVTVEVLKEGGMFSKGVYLVKVKEDAKPATPKKEVKPEPKRAAEDVSQAKTPQAGKREIKSQNKVAEDFCVEKSSKGSHAAERADGKLATKFQKTLDFVTKLLATLDNDSTVTTQFTDTAFNINISGDNIGRLIGKNGVVLNALQTLVSSIAISNANGEGTRVFVNVGDYKEKRGNTLESLAMKKAEYVKKSGRFIKLEPMNARDRAIVHTALASVEGIKTYSTGKDPFRCLCIAPADGSETPKNKPESPER